LGELEVHGLLRVQDGGQDLQARDAPIKKSKTMALS
jgi:hypothetical protein